MSSLLARFAENSFWLARYMERTENLARILSVNLAYAADSEEVESWLPVVQLFDDGERFFSVHEHASAAAVLDWYVLDRDNPSSILAEVGMARQNARTLRHLISTEAWTQLNVFHDRLRRVQRRDLALARLAALTSSIKEDCQLHTGIVEGTFYRDQVWYFYTLGKWIERADQTTVCTTSTLNINTASYGGRPPLARSERSSAASSSARNSSKSITTASRSNGSPAADRLASARPRQRTRAGPPSKPPRHNIWQRITPDPHLLVVFRGVQSPKAK